MGDGRLNKCKECTRRDVSENYRQNRDHYVEYEKDRARLPHRVEARKAYSKTPAGRVAIKRGIIRYKKKFPQKYVAHYITRNAIRDGIIERKPCEVCGASKAEAHHDDYSKPLDVRWLCKKHHMEHHWGTP
jgi:ribosomal protein S27AE